MTIEVVTLDDDNVEQQNSKAFPALTVDRADRAPSTGFVLEVDGLKKKRFGSDADAKEEALQLKTNFPMLQVKIYDAAQKSRTLIEAPVSDAARRDVV